MLVEFEEMPDHARLWIYQANRTLNEYEVAYVQEYTATFLKQWQAHGQDLKSSFRLAYNQFLVITADEQYSEASGCSIDASVRIIQVLEDKLGISFITTGQVAFLLNEKIKLFPFNGIKQQIQAEVITPDTQVFDNTVKNLSEFRKRWIASSSDTWVNRYFN